MTHSDPDMLAMLAMGETASAEDAAHVDACPDCLAELTSLRRVADLARSGAPEEPLLSPDPAVWSRISSQLGFAADVAPAPFAHAERDAAVPPAPESMPEPVSMPAHRARRTRRWVAPVLVAATAALLVAGVSVTIALQQQAAPTVLADVVLDPLPGWAGASGEAKVEEGPSGHRDLVLTASVPSEQGGFREVWLISSDLTGVVSLGVLDGSDGTFAIPDGIDLADYPIVDVSQEPLDGDPVHSGDSIVRGSVE
ncbi:MAG: anti-sigma factor [Burkholderiaceae bacterium]|nr:anti-sigma factor [Microbacteriaceae bacterium]